jgi:hypothetical protein
MLSQGQRKSSKCGKASGRCWGNTLPQREGEKQESSSPEKGPVSDLSGLGAEC